MTEPTPPTESSLPSAPDADEAVDLRDVLLDLGVPSDDIDRAADDGTLELLALERIVSFDEPRYDLAEVAALVRRRRR